MAVMNIVKEAREKKGYSQSELARMVGRHPSAINKIESGDTASLKERRKKEEQTPPTPPREGTRSIPETRKKKEERKLMRPLLDAWAFPLTICTILAITCPDHLC